MIRDHSVAKLVLPALPQLLLDIAYQPIARGGPHHFATGNIRFVNMARRLVEDTGERDKLTKGSVWQGDDWVQFFHDRFDLDEDKDADSEKLLIESQNVYQCVCNKFI